MIYTKYDIDISLCAEITLAIILGIYKMHFVLVLFVYWPDKTYKKIFNKPKTTQVFIDLCKSL